MENVQQDLTQIDNAYTLSIEEIFERLETNPDTGISEEEAKKRLTIPNTIITQSPSIWSVYIAPLLDVLIIIYLIMSGILALLSIIVPDIMSKLIFWFIFIGLNIVLAIYQQFRAQRKMEALKQLTPHKSTVLRDGKLISIDVENLVPGDIINLKLGDRIPADARIITSNELSANEASLTGESDPAGKFMDGRDPLPGDTPIGKRKNMLYLGTFVQTGEALAVIVRTGNYTELGKLATSMSKIEKDELPLRNKINRLGTGLGLLMVSFLFLLIILTVVQRINSGVHYTLYLFAFDLTQAIVNAMAVMPINIPLLTTVVLITGVLAMARENVVIKNLAAVETLGRCSVLCSDKTGTITSSQMTCKLVWDTQKYYSVVLDEDMYTTIHEINKNDISDIIAGNKPLKNKKLNKISPSSHLGLVITSAVLNNKAKVEPQYNYDNKIQVGWKYTGNPTDAALLALTKSYGLNEEYIRNRYREIRSYPFNSSVKRMSGQYEDTEEGDYMIFTKGASEVIIPRCNKIGNENEIEELTEAKKQEILDEVNKFANRGYRVISVAYKSIDRIIDHKDKQKERELVESDLIYIGFAIIYDPPRPGVSNAVSDLDNAGIFPIMITGDSPTTAGTIAELVGILDPDEIVVEGKMASTLPDDEFFRVSVFARVSPQDKEIIVSRYQKRGDIVGMTGDGVNDALAITKADAGIAMGVTGTDVTKEAADIIISDDSYVSIVKGVEEGRNLYDKIRMMIFFYIAVNLAEAIMYFTGSLKLDFYILNNWQRVYIFMIVHSLPVLAIIFGPPDRKIMKLKPRQNDEILNKHLMTMMAIYSLSLAIIIIVTYNIFYHGIIGINNFNKGGIYKFITLQSNEVNLLAESYFQVKARTAILSIIYISESLMVLSIRRVNENVINGSRDANIIVWVFVLLGLIFHISVMYITPFQLTLASLGLGFEIMRFSLTDILIVLPLALIPNLLIEVYKSIMRNKQKQL